MSSSSRPVVDDVDMNNTAEDPLAVIKSHCII
ncbi:hypothetical protein MY11210_001207 [Beauveria gryllotalpidicola]